MSKPPIDEFKAFVRQLARESASVILPYFGQPSLVVEQKSDFTPVTAADRNAEAHMRRVIEERYPHHGIIGEEYGQKEPDAEFVWVLDPVDGTKSFAAHNAQFGTLIGLLHEGRPIIGAINLPASNQLLLGDGVQTTLNGVPVTVSPSSLCDSILVTTELDNPRIAQNEEGWENLLGKVRKLYTWGDCYGYYLLCAGGVHIACDPIMNPWDLLPLIPVVEGAGGRITDWQGNDARYGKSALAAHPALIDEVVAILNP